VAPKVAGLPIVGGVAGQRRGAVDTAARQQKVPARAA
jgi:hypothetical protein